MLHRKTNRYCSHIFQSDNKWCKNKSPSKIKRRKEHGSMEALTCKCNKRLEVLNALLHSHESHALCKWILNMYVDYHASTAREQRAEIPHLLERKGISKIGDLICQTSSYHFSCNRWMSHGSKGENGRWRIWWIFLHKDKRFTLLEDVHKQGPYIIKFDTKSSQLSIKKCSI